MGLVVALGSHTVACLDRHRLSTQPLGRESRHHMQSGMVGRYRILRDMHRVMEETVVVSWFLDRAEAQHTAEEDTVAESRVVSIVEVVLRDIVVVVVCCGLAVVGVALQLGVGLQDLKVV